MRHHWNRLIWKPSDESPLQHLAMVLSSWEGTPYLKGASLKKTGVDCVRFVCAVTDEMHGISREIPGYAQDAGLNNRAASMGVMREFFRAYPEYERVLSSEIFPGDLIVTGPPAGGPSHVFVVGPEERRMWSAGKAGVTRTGIAPQAREHEKIFAIYRFKEHPTWP